MSGLIKADIPATDEPASCPTNKSILSIFRALIKLSISVVRFNNRYSDMSTSYFLTPPDVRPYPLISGAITLKPSLAKIGIIFRQLKLNSGKP